jgi:hypothetical protein
MAISFAIAIDVTFEYTCVKDSQLQPSRPCNIRRRRPPHIILSSSAPSKAGDDAPIRDDELRISADLLIVIFAEQKGPGLPAREELRESLYERLHRRFAGGDERRSHHSAKVIHHHNAWAARSARVTPAVITAGRVNLHRSPRRDRSGVCCSPVRGRRSHGGDRSLTSRNGLRAISNSAAFQDGLRNSVLVRWRGH